MVKIPLRIRCWLQFIRKYFFKLFHLWPDYKSTIGLIAVQAEIILVVIFSGIKMVKCCNFGYDRIIICTAFVQLDFIIFGLSFLFSIMVENYAAILRTNIISLTIERGGVVRFPEYFQQFVETNQFRIIDDLQTFGMTGFTGANVFIRRVFNGSSGIAGGHF